MAASQKDAINLNQQLFAQRLNAEETQRELSKRDVKGLQVLQGIKEQQTQIAQAENLKTLEIQRFEKQRALDKEEITRLKLELIQNRAQKAPPPVATILAQPVAGGDPQQNTSTKAKEHEHFSTPESTTQHGHADARSAADQAPSDARYERMEAQMASMRRMMDLQLELMQKSQVQADSTAAAAAVRGSRCSRALFHDRSSASAPPDTSRV